MRTGKPIVYTSGDSVFQIAAHVDVIPLERLYEMCSIARELSDGGARGGPGDRPALRGCPGRLRADRRTATTTRCCPPSDTVLDEITAAGLEVRGVGKIYDIFAERGFTHTHPTRSNDEGITAVDRGAESLPSAGLVFANLVDFDQAFGHRNDPSGYAGALEAFDRRLPEIAGRPGARRRPRSSPPTTATTRRRRPPTTRARRSSCSSPGRGEAGVDVGERASFTDLGATVADLLGVETETPGRSFAAELVRQR